MRKLDELDWKASKKLLGLFVPEASPGLAGHEERGKTRKRSYPASLYLRRPCLRGPSNRMPSKGWKFKQAGANETSLWLGRNVGKDEGWPWQLGNCQYCPLPHSLLLMACYGDLSWILIFFYFGATAQYTAALGSYSFTEQIWWAFSFVL